MTTHNVSQSDQSFGVWISAHYLDVILIFLFIYTLLPIMAPVLEKYGMDFSSRLIYWIYSNLCHQLPYRSWFLFGKQAYYPLIVINNAQILDFSTAFGYGGDLELSRSIIGSQQLGYKVAVCQRDLAMYSGLFMTGILFTATGKKWTRIPLWLWIVFGVLPMGIDGLSQLAGSFSLLSSIFPIRESTPLLRTLTGVSFGIFSGLYLFPLMQMKARQPE